jgi:hypothetical protein
LQTLILASAFDTGLFLCVCSFEDTKKCFLFLPFQPCEEFYCKCLFVGESALASLLSWKLHPAPIACYLLLQFG